MKKLCETYREDAITIIIAQKKKKQVVNKRTATIIRKDKNLLFFKEAFEDKYPNDEKVRKVRDHCHYTGKYSGAAHSLSNLEYIIAKEVTIVFSNGLSCSYHFIKKELAKEFKREFTSLGENTKKCITFSVPI